MVLLAWGQLQSQESIGSSCTENGLDLLWVIDATSSMREYLPVVAERMQMLEQRIESSLENASLRTGAIVFRDYGERFLYQQQLLTTERKKASTFVQQFRAVGGGDDIEPLNEVLQIAAKTNWSNVGGQRVLIVLTDARPRSPAENLATARQLKAQGIMTIFWHLPEVSTHHQIWREDMVDLTNGLSLDWYCTVWYRMLLDRICPQQFSMPTVEVQAFKPPVVCIGDCPACLGNQLYNTGTPAAEMQEESIDVLLQEKPAPNLIVFPNPAHDQLTIQVEKQQPLDQLVIFNSAGIKVAGPFNPSATHLELSVKDWPAGAYLIKLGEKNKTLIVE